MKCPACNNELKMADRQGVEIDYCPQCRGVWLDRGELDKIIERSMQQPAARAPQHAPPPAHGGQRSPHDSDYGHKYDDDYKRRRRKSFLGEIFDFD